MMNQLMNMMGGGNPMQMLAQLKANPIALLSQRFNIPNGINTNDPQAILQQLVSSGQISQSQFNQAYQQAQQMGYKF